MNSQPRSCSPAATAAVAAVTDSSPRIGKFRYSILASPVRTFEAISSGSTLTAKSLQIGH